MWKFEVFLDKKEEYRFRLVAANGEIVAQSEGYKNRRSCTDTIHSIMANVDSAAIVLV